MVSRAKIFEKKATNISKKANMYIWGISFCVLLLTLIMISLTENRHNYRLILLVLTMMAVEGSQFIFQELREHDTSHKLIADAFYVSSDTYVHWLFCLIYLKLAIDVKYLLDKRIYLSNSSIIKQCKRDNLYLDMAHCLNIVICIGLFIMQAFLKG